MQLEQLVVRCSPCRLPHCLPVLLEFANRNKNVFIDTSVHIHSDVRVDNDAQRDKLLNFLPKSTVNSGKASLKLMLIYSSFDNATHTKYLSFQLNNNVVIEGEVNLAKYLALKLNLWNEIHNVDEARLDEIYKVLMCDEDIATFVVMLKEWISKPKQFISQLKEFGVPDLLAYSYVKDIPTKKVSDPVFIEWKNNCFAQLAPFEEKEATLSNDDKERLFAFFNQHQIKFDTIDHPEVFTVDAMMPYLQNITGAISKNLFLKDKKGNLYLMSALYDKTVNLKGIAKAIGAPGGDLRFASEDILFDVLGVKQGCVTAYALLNDIDKTKVKFLVDEDIINGKFERVYFHPLVNTATTGISCDDFKKFVTLTGHGILPVTLV